MTQRASESECVIECEHVTGDEGFFHRKLGLGGLSSITCDRISNGSKASSSPNAHNCHWPVVSLFFKL